MIYLVGVNHGVQFIKASYTNDQIDIVNNFGAFIQEKVKKLDIEMIAEEMDTESLNKHNAKSYIKEIAEERKIGHSYCNPTTQEINQLHIITDEDREKEWLKRIKDSSKKKVLFICGYTHLHSFKSLLEINGIESEILSENHWGKELNSQEQIRKIIEQDYASS